MAKKILCLFFIICVLVSITFCSEASSTHGVFPFVSITEDEIAAMSTYMCYGSNAISGKWIYGRTHSINGLSKYKVTDVHERYQLTEDAYMFLQVNKGWVYYILPADLNEIRKISISGDQKQTIIHATGEILLFHMQVYQDQIYYGEYIDNDGKFYRTNLDGSGKEVVLDKPVYYPYIINGKLFYQDDKDLCRLHVCGINGEDDICLIDDVVFQFITDGRMIIYESTDKPVIVDENGNYEFQPDLKYAIKKYDIDTGKTETLLIGNISLSGFHNNTVFYLNMDDSDRLYAYNLRDDSVDLVIQDKFIETNLFTNDGIYCMIYTSSEHKHAVDYVYIDYKNYKKKSLQ